MDQYSREFIAEKARLRLDRFYRATREFGRVFKTEFILDYLSQPALRTRIRRGLLKGEQLHALARCVHYGRLGRLDQRDFERQTGAASCLLLILAAIIYWQIREIDRVLSEAGSDADDLNFELLSHISPRSGGTTSSSTASTSSTAVSCEAKGLAYKFARVGDPFDSGSHKMLWSRESIYQEANPEVTALARRGAA